MPLLKAAWRQLRTFFGYSGEASYLWPRWLVLRAVGLVYVIIFAGILQEGRALVGPHGLSHLAEYCTYVGQYLPNPFVRFLRAPSLLLLSSDPLVVTALEWGGLAAALALVLNLWPRLALFICWVVLLSFVSMWRELSSTLNDPLMLETALLCLPFAPAGLRPGLGTASPPRPVTVLMMRWLLIRIMLTAGLIKLLGSDPGWRNFTFMEKMYETSPAPTVLAYHVFHLPHAFHVGEILFTFAAELVAPVLAIWGGRRGRAVAVVTWTLFQLGIQLTGNFAWLNTASIALGLLLLDDQMIAAGLRWLRLGAWAERIGARAAMAEVGRVDRNAPSSGRRASAGALGSRRSTSAPATAGPARGFPVVATLLWLHFALTLWYPAVFLRGLRVPGLPDPRTEPLQFLFRDFRSANCYSLYATTPPSRDDIEFAGSNDGGRTWRPYPFRYKPQREDRMSPFLAPRFGRFEATLQLVLDGHWQVSLIPDVAHALLEGNPDVIGLFASNPFPDTPPTMVRMIVYRYSFTDLKTYHDTGRYWSKEYVGEYAPPVTAARP